MTYLKCFPSLSFLVNPEDQWDFYPAFWLGSQQLALFTPWAASPARLHVRDEATSSHGEPVTAGPLCLCSSVCVCVLQGKLQRCTHTPPRATNKRQEWKKKKKNSSGILKRSPGPVVWMEAEKCCIMEKKDAALVDCLFPSFVLCD